MNHLLSIAEKENIEIIYENIPKKFRSLGYYINDDQGNSIITLHKELKNYPRLHKCILSEELGHHFTSIGESFYKAINCQFWKLNHIKTELKALKWSAFQLIPETQLDYAVECEKLITIYDLEEYFSVTRELMLFRLRYRKDISFLCLDNLLIEEDEYIKELLNS